MFSQSYINTEGVDCVASFFSIFYCSLTSSVQFRQNLNSNLRCEYKKQPVASESIWLYDDSCLNNVTNDWKDII